MIEAAFIFGLVIFLGIALVLWKLPTGITLWLLGHHMLLDISIVALATWMHWGTMTGLMSAAMAGLICTATTSLARMVVGYTVKGKYHPGWYHMKT